jgi:predicted CoA-binding protein
MQHDRYDDDVIGRMLAEVQVIALVGASANSNRPSTFVLKYLLAKGYRVVPVNPGLAGQEICGQRVVTSLSELVEPVDMIDIFRNSDAALDVVREALQLKERLGLKVIWMQLGVRNDKAAAQAEAAGLRVIMNRCPKIEYGRLSGEIGWTGVATGMLTSRRPLLGSGLQSQRIGKG